MEVNKLCLHSHLYRHILAGFARPDLAELPGAPFPVFLTSGEVEAEE